MRRMLLRLAVLSAATALLSLAGSCGGEPESGWRTLVEGTVTVAEGDSAVHGL